MLVMVASALIIAGVALFVAAPLSIGALPTRRKSARDESLERFEHERSLAIQGLRELEFDREMGKLADPDYESLKNGLEARALTAMQAIDEARKPSLVRELPPAAVASPAESVRREPAPVLTLRPDSGSRAPHVRFCPQCGTRTLKDARFCGECGAALKPPSRATNWNE